MSDQTKAKDPGGIWRDQPEEELPVTLKRNVNRRTEELYFRTRSEILMSIGAALLPIGTYSHGGWKVLSNVFWKLDSLRSCYGSPSLCFGFVTGSGAATLRGRKQLPRPDWNTIAPN